MAAASSSSVDDNFVGALHAVTPLAGCPHLKEVAALPDGGIDAQAVCSSCGISAEPWVCLTCFKAHCGRHVYEHAVLHFTISSHPMTLSLSDLSVWCYPCDAYVHNSVLQPHKSDAHLKKFGVPAPN